MKDVVTKAPIRSIGDVVRLKPFRPDLARTDFKNLADNFEGVLIDADYIEEFYSSDYGRKPAVRLALILDEDDALAFTTLSTNVAIVNQVRQVIDGNEFPLMVNIKKVDHEDGKFHYTLDGNIIIPEPEEEPQF